MDHAWKNRVFAASLVTLIHFAAVLALILPMASGGSTVGELGVSELRVVTVSIARVEHHTQESDTRSREANPKSGTGITANGRKADHPQSQSNTQQADSSQDAEAAHAVTLEPDATPAMTDPAVLYYRKRLEEHLARYSQYPLDARRDHIQGTVYIHFLLDRDGHVLNDWIERSSGSLSLDGEALAAISRAQPLPPIPIGWPSQLDVTLPLSFSLE